jgi:hypothetical protein
MMTPQQQLDAFLTHCAELRQGYVFSFKKTSSSLRHLIAELERQIRNNAVSSRSLEGILRDLQRTSPKDHVKYRPALLSLAAVWGSTRDYVRRAYAAGDAVQTLYWNAATGGLEDAPTRIAISSRNSAYHVAVAKHLSALTNAPAGQTLLNALSNSAFLVSIIDHWLSNQCGGGRAGMNSVARELYDTATLAIGPQTRAALQLANVGGQARPAWLAAQINATPQYDLKGLPATAPCNIGVNAGQVQAWIDGTRTIWNDYGNDAALAQIKNGIIVALYQYATPGNGCPSNVNYSLGSANPMNEERPPAIGLAHELVHAYYNGRGEQPGWEVDHPTTVLFEYRCVGLGPWNGAAVSENALRAGFDNALLFFDDDDNRNRKHVDARPWYSAP